MYSRPTGGTFSPRRGQTSPAAPELEQFLAALTEDDLIQDAIVSFEGWQQQVTGRLGRVPVRRPATCWSRSLSSSRSKPSPEQTSFTGVATPITFVIEQYKVLTKDNLINTMTSTADQLGLYSTSNKSSAELPDTAKPVAASPASQGLSIS